VTITPFLLALVLVVGVLVLLPAKRLQQAGLSSRAIGTYVMLLWFGAILVASRVGPSGVMVPLLLAGYLAPFMVGPEQLARFLRRGARPEPRPMKNVTPPEDRLDGPPR
jgi:hypothetical protein